MRRGRTNPDFLNGVPELAVLEMLARQPMYGYELVQAIREQSGGVLAFGEGCIYPLLHKLEQGGELSARRIDVGGRTRVVYRVTAQGRKAQLALAARWALTVEAVGRLLQGGKHERA